MADKIYDMDDLDLSGISLDDLAELPDLPDAENDWKHKEVQAEPDKTQLDIPGLDMDVLEFSGEVELEEVQPSYRSSSASSSADDLDIVITKEEVSEPVIPPPPPPLPKSPMSGLPAGYVPPTGGITVNKRTDVPPLTPVSGGINVEKKSVSIPNNAGTSAPVSSGISVQKKTDLPPLKAPSGGISVEKKSVTIPGASNMSVPMSSGISVQKKSEASGGINITIPKKETLSDTSMDIELPQIKKPVSVNTGNSGNISLTKPTDEVRTAPAEISMDDDYDINEPVAAPKLADMDDIPMPKLSSMDDTPAKAVRAVDTNHSSEVRKLPTAPSVPAPKLSEPYPSPSSSSARRRNLDEGFDEPIRVSQLSKQAMIDAQMQDFERGQREMYEKGKTTVLVIAIIYSALCIVGLLMNFSVRGLTKTVVRIAIARELVQGKRSAKYWFIAVNLLLLFAYVLLLVVLPNMASSAGMEITYGVVDYISYGIEIAFSLYAVVMLLFNKNVKVYLNNT